MFISGIGVGILAMMKIKEIIEKRKIYKEGNTEIKHVITI